MRATAFHSPSIWASSFLLCLCLSYAAVTYVRIENDAKQIYSAFLVGKACVVPLKNCTFPRMKLTAAVLAAQLDRLGLTAWFLQVCVLELFDSYTSNLWSSSQPQTWTNQAVSLKNIQNSHKRFPMLIVSLIEYWRLLVLHRWSQFL